MTLADTYTLADRLLHRFAYSGSVLQKSLAQLDTSLCAKHLESIELRNPVFIAGLARSGTTTLLNILHETGGFASASYRDMPFVYAPVIWNRMTASQFKAGEYATRAHDDGILVNEESPEAFDEVIWKLWFPEKYDRNHIHLWSGTEGLDEFAQVFRDLAAKFVYLRANEAPSKTRYLSKTNGSISRIPVLRRMFPDALILIPYRDPSQHISSLQKQDRHFKSLQKKNRFVLKYMNDLGHHEFGLGKKIVAFPGLANPNTCEDLEHWQDYWQAAYSHLLNTLDENVILFNYDAACNNSVRAVDALLERLGIDKSLSDRITSSFELQGKHDVLCELSEDCRAVWERLINSPNNLVRE